MAGTPVTIPTDLVVLGNFAAKSQTLSAGSVGDSNVAALAGIQASKLQHQYKHPYSQANGVASVTETKVAHVVYGATATVIGFVAGAITPLTGADTCTVDVKKNGTSILTAPISLLSTDAAYATHAGTVTTSAAVAGDVFTVVVTVTHSSGTQPQGVFAQIVLREDAQ